MAVPVVAVRVDWDNDGTFAGGYDDVTADVATNSLTWTRGRSADASGEATGAAAFTLLNAEDRYTPDRNWCDNGSFEVNTLGWGKPVRGNLTDPAAIARVSDTGAGAGAYAAEVTCGAVAYQGTGYTISYPFRAGTAYAISFMLKSVSGGTYMVWGVAANDDVYDFMEDAANITGSWVRRTIYWTPYVDRDRAGIYVLHVDATAAVFRMDGIQVNPAVGYPGAVLATKPIAYWGLEELDGAAHDYTGTYTGSYDSTPSRGQTRLVTTGRSMVTDGTDGVSFTGPIIAGGDWTLAAWIRPTTVAAGWHGIIGSADGGVVLGFNAAALYVSCTNVFDAPAATGFTPVINTTYFVAATYRQATGKLRYLVNGAFISEHTWTPGWTTTARQRTIGAHSVVGSYGWVGTIDEPAIWSRTLEDAEIAGLYAAGGVTPTLNAYLEAPTKGQLTPGRPVHIFAEYGDTGNLVSNGSFEPGTTGWSTAGLSPYCLASTSVTQVTDNAPGQLGSKAGEVVFTGTYESGVVYQIPGTFLQGVTYTCGVWVKSVSGQTSFTAALVDPAGDAGAWGGTITTSWAYYTFTWTPSADRTAGYFMLRQQVAGACTVRIDTLSVSGPGTYPLFYGYLQRYSPNPKAQTTSVTAYDPRGAMDRVSMVLAAGSRTHREIRLEALNAFGATWQNLLSYNPQFATNTTGWTVSGGTGTTMTRITTDYPPVPGVTTCVEISHSGTDIYLNSRVIDQPLAIGDIVNVSYWAKVATYSDASDLYGYTAVGNDTDGSLITDRYGTGGALYTGDWREYRYAMVVTAAAGGLYLNIVQSSAGADTTVFRVGAIQVTYGKAAHPYHATGGGQGTLTRNLVSQPSFEVSGSQTTVAWSKASTVFTATGAADPVILVDPGASGSRYLRLEFTNTLNSGHYYTGFYLVYEFKANQPYVFSLYTKGQYNGYSFDIIIGNSTDYGVSAFTSSTAWTQWHIHWTPSADRNDVNLWVRASGTSGASCWLNIDAVAVYPGTSEVPYEPTFAELDVEDGRAIDYAATGSTKAVIDSINAVTLSRHWVRPLMSAPYWRFKTENLATIRAKESVETFAGDDFTDFTGSDISDDAIINVVTVQPGTKYMDTSGVVQTNSTANLVAASDAVSVGKHGIREGSAVSSALIENVPFSIGGYNHRALQTALADDIIEVNGTARSWPTMTVVNRFPSILQRELDDLITVYLERLGIAGARYTIQSVTVNVTSGSAVWTAQYRLEESV